LSQCTRLTDRQTDRRTDGRTSKIFARLRLHSVQRGKNDGGVLAYREIPTLVPKHI